MKIWIFTTLICSFGLGTSIINASKKSVPKKVIKNENTEETFIDMIAEEANDDLNETAEKLIKGAQALQEGAEELSDIAKDAKSLLKNVGDIGKIVANLSNIFSR